MILDGRGKFGCSIDDLPSHSVHAERHQSASCRPSGSSSFDFINEEAEVDLLSIDHNRRFPLPERRIPVDATIPRGHTYVTREVLLLLGVRHDAQVAPPVVERVAVDVIALARIAALQPEQLAVKIERSSATTFVSADDVAITRHSPMPLCHEIDVCCIKQRVRSHRSITGIQWDARSQTIVADLSDLGATGPSASYRAVLRSIRRRSVESRLAGRTDKLLRHRTSPSRAFGVAPRAATNSAGAFACLNFSTSRRAS
jgi:hypothetical protein